MSIAVKARQRVERSIARRVVLDALRAGYSLSVFDGEEVTLKHSRKPKEILAALFTTDEDHLLFHKVVEGEPEVGSVMLRTNISNVDSGWVRFVYGNDGYDVICDYTTNLEEVLTGANALAERYSE